MPWSLLSNFQQVGNGWKKQLHFNCMFNCAVGNPASFSPRERSTISTVDERNCSVQEDDFKAQPKRKW
ncbi:hypothetical protein NC651_022198 [Populus alba x Populus x berolinensis]|nr:hypothetical protein NC651_022198 [Populus alba x Populus x berolinensis]